MPWGSILTTNQLRLDAAQAIGSRWLTYYPAYVWLLPLWLVGSVFSTPVNDNWGELLSLLWINGLALSVCAAETILFGRTLWKRSRQRMQPGTPLWAVITGGAILGISKVLVTVALSNLVLTTHVENLLGRLIASTALGIGLVVLIPLCLSRLEMYRTEREILISELIRSELATSAQERARASSEGILPPTATPHSVELERFVEKSLAKLASIELHPERLPDVLDSIRTEEIRPLSHRIWRRENERLPEFTLSNLIGMSLTQHHFAVIPVLLGYIIVVGPALIFGYGVPAGILALGVQLSIIAAVIAAVKFLPPRGQRWGLGVFFSATLLMTVLIMLATTTIFGQIPTLLPAQSAISLLLSLITLMLATSVVNLALRTHHQMHLDLLELNPLAGQVSLQRAQQARTDRELAQLLHSQVQNVFLSQSMQLRNKLSQSDHSDFVKRRMSEQTKTEIEAYLHKLVANPAGENESISHENWATSAIAAWEPVLDITLNGASSLSTVLSTDQRKTVAEILKEAIANALRHGLAQQVICDLHVEEGVLTITVEDDGVGPRHGAAGLGSFYFTAIPDSQWSLTSAQDLAGARFQLVWRLSAN